MIITMKTRAPHMISILGGDYFGERGLLFKEARAATVNAEGEVRRSAPTPRPRPALRTCRGRRRRAPHRGGLSKLLPAAPFAGYVLQAWAPGIRKGVCASMMPA